MIEVTGPDGAVHSFPDGTDPAVVKTAMDRHYRSSDTFKQGAGEYAVRRTEGRLGRTFSETWNRSWIAEGYRAGRLRAAEGIANKQAPPSLELNPAKIVGGIVGSAQSILDNEGTLKDAREDVAAERARRQEFARDFPLGSFLKDENPVASGAASLAGVIGATALDPTSWVAPGRTALERVGAQAAIAGGLDGAAQQSAVSSGTQDDYQVEQTVVSAAAGGVFTGLGEAVGAGLRKLRARGETPADAAAAEEAVEFLERPALTTDDLDVPDLGVGRGVTPEAPDGRTFGAGLTSEAEIEARLDELEAAAPVERAEDADALRAELADIKKAQDDLWSRDFELTIEEFNAEAKPLADRAEDIRRRLDAAALTARFDRDWERARLRQRAGLDPFPEAHPDARREVLHGSNSGFIERFRDDLLGSNTAAPSATVAHFFSGRAEARTSMAYTDHVLSNKRLVPYDPDAGRASIAEAAERFFSTWRERPPEAQRAAWIDEVLARIAGGESPYRAADLYIVGDHPSAASIVALSNKLDGEDWPFHDNDHRAFVEHVGRASQAIYNDDDHRLYYQPVVDEPGGAAIGRYRLDLRNPLIHDFKGEAYREESYKALLDRAKANGHDGVILKNTYDGGEEDDIYAVFSPSQIVAVGRGDGLVPSASATPLTAPGILSVFEWVNDDPALSPRWRALPEAERDAISDALMNWAAPQVFARHGVEGEIEPAVAAYGADLSRAHVFRLNKAEKSLDVAADLAAVMGQKTVGVVGEFRVHDDMELGSMLVLNFQEVGITSDTARLGEIARLLREAEPDLFSGFMVDGQSVLLLNQSGLEIEAFAARIEQALNDLPELFDIDTADVHFAFKETGHAGKTYDAETDGSGASARRWADHLRREAAARLEAEVARAERDLGINPGPRAGPSGTLDGELTTAGPREEPDGPADLWGEIEAAGASPTATARMKAAVEHLDTLRKLIKPEAVARFVAHLKQREPIDPANPGKAHINSDAVDWDALDADPGLFEAWQRTLDVIFRDVYQGAGDARVSWAQTERAARLSGMSLTEIATTHRRIVGEGGLAARLGAMNEVAVAHADRFAKALDDLETKLQNGTSTDKDIADFAALTEQATLIQSMYAGSASEVGRALRYLAKAKQGAELVNDIQAAIDGLGAGAKPEVLKAAVSRLRQAYKKKGAAGLTDEVRKMRTLGVWDYAGYYLTGNLLSAFATHLRNAVGTPLHMTFQVLERYAAAAGGAARLGRGGKERVTFSEANAYVFAAHKAFIEAAFTGARAFREGRPVTDGGTSMIDDAKFSQLVPFKIDAARRQRWGSLEAWRKNPVKQALDIPTALTFSAIRTFGYRPSVAADEFWKVMARRMQLDALAVREAKYLAARAEPSKRDAVYRKTVAALSESPTDAALREAKAAFPDRDDALDMFDWDSKAGELALALRRVDIEAMAADHARLVTFQKAGKHVEAIDRTLRMFPLVKHLAVNFIRTPMALLKAGLVDRNPATAWMTTENRGNFKYLYKAAVDAEEGLKRGGAEADLMIARLSMGVGIMTWAWYMWANGDLRGRQGSYQDRKDGVLDYSIRIPGTDEWVQFSTASPLAEPLGLVADVAQALRDHDGDDDSAASLMGALVAAMANNVTNKTFMTGVEQVMEIMGSGRNSSMASDDETQGEQVGRALTGLVVPRIVPLASLLRAEAYERDPVIRDARGLLDRFKAQTPTWSETLPAKRDFMGRPLLRKEGERGRLQAWRTSRVDDDPVVAELARLNEEIGGGFRIAPAPRKFNGQDLDPVEYGHMVEVQGQLFIDPDTGLNMEQAIRGIIASPEYAALQFDEQRAEVLKKTVSWYRKAATAAMHDPASPHYWAGVTTRTGVERLREEVRRKGLDFEAAASRAEALGVPEDALTALSDDLAD